MSEHQNSTNRIALVTGATRGIGLATATRLAEAGWTVWAGARTPGTGPETPAGLPGQLRVLDLDVTSDDSVAAAAARVADESGHLDLLVNNAGVGSRFVPAAETLPADFLPVFGVNLLGPVRVTRAFLPHLGRAATPRVVMVSSGLGSFGITTDPDRFESTISGIVYPASKAALNMATSQYAKALPEIDFVAVDPGYTATDLNNHSGHQSVDEAAAIVLTACTASGVSGRFLGRDGAELPW